MLAHRLDTPRARLETALLVVAATLNGALRYSLWESQMAVVPMLGVVGAFWAWQGGRTAWLALFAYVAALKPQIGTLPLLFLLINGGARGVVLGGLVAVGIGVGALVPSGITAWPSQMADCFARHMAAGFNQRSTFSHLSALFGDTAFANRMFWVSPLLAVAWIVALTLYSRRARDKSDSHPVWMLVLVTAAIPALMPLHEYDLVTYTPTVIA